MTTEKYFVGKSADKKLVDQALNCLKNEPGLKSLDFYSHYSEKESLHLIGCEAKPEFVGQDFIEPDCINARAYFTGFQKSWWLSKG